MKIVHITENRAGYVNQIQELLKQLTSKPVQFDADAFTDIIKNKNTLLFAATDEHDPDTILGILTLLLYRIPSGFKAHIEDVVVDQKARGKGIGAALTQHAIQFANSRGAGQITLTSHPSRETANRLYQRLGFERYETNVYVYNVSV